MIVTIKIKNLEHSGALNEFVGNKFESLAKFVDNGKKSAEIFVEIEKETKHHKKGEIFLVKAQIILFNKNIMAEARGDDLFVTVGKAKDELKAEIEKFGEKRIDVNRREARKSKEEIEL